MEPAAKKSFRFATTYAPSSTLMSNRSKLIGIRAGLGTGARNFVTRDWDVT
jgi:hypothetical protein